jgi:ABC-type transport system substrate-binding protein
LRGGHPKNSWRVADAELDKLLDAQQQETDDKQRQVLAKRIWDRMNDQVYRADVPRGSFLWAYQPWVKNYRATNGYYNTGLTYGSWQTMQIWVDDKAKYM